MEKANAIQLVGRILYHIAPFARISSLDAPGKANAIASKGTIVMHTSSQDEEALLKELSKLEEMLKAQFSETENLSFRLEKEEQKKEVTVFTEETVNLIIEAITFLPCGVISRTRENVEMVQTSSNIGSMTIQDGTLEFLCSGRSSVKLEKAQLKEKMQILSKALE